MKNFCGGIYSRKKCQLTKKEWIKVGLNPKSINTSLKNWSIISVCQYLTKNGKCLLGLKLKKQKIYHDISCDCYDCRNNTSLKAKD